MSNQIQHESVHNYILRVVRLSWRSRRPLPRPDRSVPSFPSRVKEDNARPPADARADRQPLSASDQADRQPISASDQGKLLFERKASVRFTVAIGIGVNAHPLEGSAETSRFVSIWRIKSTPSIVGNILAKSRSFSAVSVPIFASKYTFFSIF